MQFFIDSANPNEIFPAYETGLISGVTTNPSLAVKAGINYKDAVLQILQKVNGPVSLEVLSTNLEGMLHEGRELAKLHTNVVVKLPMSVDAVKAAQILKSEGIKTNMTLVFSAAQALIVGKIGCDYVSPFVGRFEDQSEEGLGLIEEIRQIYDNYGFETNILIASVRSPLVIAQAAAAGADVATLPADVFWKLFNHPMTESGLNKFLKDFKESGIQPLV